MLHTDKVTNNLRRYQTSIVGFQFKNQSENSDPSTASKNVNDSIERSTQNADEKSEQVQCCSLNLGKCRNLYQVVRPWRFGQDKTQYETIAGWKGGRHFAA